jgi:Rad3-related DNA helicase
LTAADQVQAIHGKADELTEIDHYFLLLQHDDVMIDWKLKLPPDVIDLKKRSARTIGFWCFNPGLGFRKVLNLNPRCVILTSGTLSPLQSFQQELLVDFPVTIENKHVVRPEQACISIVTHGVRGSELNFSHKHRDDEAA